MVIQIRQIMKGNDEDDNIELIKVINFLDEEKIEYDLEPPKKFKEWKTVGNKTFLIGEDL